uniref:Uncharacterized protein n=1 Tax=Marseillevirus LCMAC103 TaxID=2506604 RepID=A0A481YUH6_9VIRU|nr:MAG: hypothetical protein LCMAC103_03050 [Marseillevirus LCMAC103]
MCILMCTTIFDLALGIPTLIYANKNFGDDCQMQAAGITFTLDTTLRVTGILSIVMALVIFSGFFASLVWEKFAAYVVLLWIVYALFGIAWFVVLSIVFWDGSQDCLHENRELWNIGLANFIIKAFYLVVSCCTTQTKD